MKALPTLPWLTAALIWMSAVLTSWSDDMQPETPNAGDRLRTELSGFRIGIKSANGELKPEETAGLWLRPKGTREFLSAQTATWMEDDGLACRVVFSDSLSVRVVQSPTTVRFAVDPEGDGKFGIRFQFAGGMNPAFGLGDQGGYERAFN